MPTTAHAAGGLGDESNSNCGGRAAERATSAATNPTSKALRNSTSGLGPDRASPTTRRPATDPFPGRSGPNAPALRTGPATDHSHKAIATTPNSTPGAAGWRPARPRGHIRARRPGNCPAPRRPARFSGDELQADRRVAAAFVDRTGFNRRIEAGHAAGGGVAINSEEEHGHQQQGRPRRPCPAGGRPPRPPAIAQPWQ